jgi:cell division initiation protein
MSEDQPVRRLSPLEIQQQRFRSVLRGFDRVEVLDFLALVRRELEALLHENRDLREALAHERAQNLARRDHEEELRRAIVTAQGMADQVLEQAHQQARLIEQEAELKARQRLHRAQEELADARAQHAALRRAQQELRLSLRGVLEGHLRLLDTHDALAPPEAHEAPQPQDDEPPLEELPPDEATAEHRRNPEMERLRRLRERLQPNQGTP